MHLGEGMANELVWLSVNTLRCEMIGLKMKQTFHPMKKKNRKAYLTHFHVAGTQYYDLLEAWKDLKVGAELKLVTEPENRYDRHAVQVWHQEFMLGYIPRSENRHMAKLLNAGWNPYKVLIQGLYEENSMSERLEVCVRILNTE